MRYILIFLLLAFCSSTQAQDINKEALKLTQQAIQEMESGKITLAIEHLKEAEKMDPGNMLYPYEIGYAHYLDKNYGKAIDIYKKLKIQIVKGEHQGMVGKDQVFQMLGNSYDMDGKPKKAIATYDEGIKMLPNSGKLRMERGTMELNKKKYAEALSYYEQGIKVDPTFASNYYRAADIYLKSSEEVWGMIYGEIFMNMERNTKRTQEMSKMLFDTYKSEIKIESDTNMSISFSQNSTISMDDLKDGKMKMPYGIGVYEPTLGMTLIDVNEINIESLNRIRTRFAKLYDEKHKKEYPNVLFDFHKKLIDLGHFEAYNHWVLIMGAKDEFDEWTKMNPVAWDSFIDWFKTSPLEINEEKNFHRFQY